MSRKVAKILADCLESIERGKSTPADCLARYPEHRQELAAFFASREAIQGVVVAPRPEFRQDARARLLSRLPEQEARAKQQAVRTWSWFRGPAPAGMRWVGAAGTVALLLVFLLSLTMGARALPGDPLYPLKIAAEEARLATTGGEKGVALKLKHTQTRVAEIEAMAKRRRPADVALAVLVLEKRVADSTGTLIQMARQDAVRLQDLRAADHVLYEAGEELASVLPSFSGASRSWVEQAIEATAGQRDRLRETFPTAIMISELAVPVD